MGRHALRSDSPQWRVAIDHPEYLPCGQVDNGGCQHCADYLLRCLYTSHLYHNSVHLKYGEEKVTADWGDIQDKDILMVKFEWEAVVRSWKKEKISR